MFSIDVLEHVVLPYLPLEDLYRQRLLSCIWYRRYADAIQRYNADISVYQHAIVNNQLQLVEDLLQSGGLQRLRIRDLQLIQEYALKYNIEALKIFFKYRQSIYGPRCWIDSIIGIQAAIEDSELFQEFIQHRRSDPEAVLILIRDGKSKQAIRLLRKYISIGSVDENFVQEFVKSSTGRTFASFTSQDIMQEFSKHLTESSIQTFPLTSVRIAVEARNWSLLARCIDLVGKENVDLLPYYQQVPEEFKEFTVQILLSKAVQGAVVDRLATIRKYNPSTYNDIISRISTSDFDRKVRSLYP